MLLLFLFISIGIIILLTVRFKVDPFLTLLFASLFYAIASGMPLPTILSSINDGFGSTLGKIGLVIVLGIILGTFLEQSGGAYKLAEVVLKVIGKNRVHEAMAIIGYIVSIPVFADSGFIIINPLNKSLTDRAKLSLAGTGVALILGLMLTHTMVPPTPGPLAAAGILNADVGLVMLVGLVVAGLSLIPAIVYSKRYVAKTYIDPTPDLSDEEIEEKMKNAPGAVKSFLPIIVPILLIVGDSILQLQLTNGVLDASYKSAPIVKIFGFIGSPVIALTIGMLLSFLLPKKFDLKMVSIDGWVGKALTEASTIILVTGAGGIFGKILQNSGIDSVLTGYLSDLNLGIWLPFIIAAALKTAQGSSTVALITTASIIAPLAAGMGYESEIEKALLVVAIGAGSAVVPHANDSGFWVVTKLTNMDVKTGYKLYTLGGFIVGTFAGFLAFIGSLFL